MTNRLTRRCRLPALLSAGAAVWAAATTAQENAIERGRELFYVHGCYGCHGFNGETGARDLVGTGSVIVENEDVFIAYLRARADQAPLLPTTQMPNYPENSLSDADARAIFAYVDSFELDAPEPQAEPTLQAILELAERPYENIE